MVGGGDGDAAAEADPDSDSRADSDERNEAGININEIRNINDCEYGGGNWIQCVIFMMAYTTLRDRLTHTRFSSDPYTDEDAGEDADSNPCLTERSMRNVRNDATILTAIRLIVFSKILDGTRTRMRTVTSSHDAECDGDGNDGNDGTTRTDTDLYHFSLCPWCVVIREDFSCWQQWLCSVLFCSVFCIRIRIENRRLKVCKSRYKHLLEIYKM